MAYFVLITTQSLILTRCICTIIRVSSGYCECVDKDVFCRVGQKSNTFLVFEFSFLLNALQLHCIALHTLQFLFTLVT